MQTRELRLLGEFTLLVDGDVVTVPGKIKKALIAMIALAPDRKIARNRLMDTLWSNRSAEQASGCLRQALAELRRLFKPSVPDLLCLSVRGVIQLNIDAENIDCLRLRQISRSHSSVDKANGIDLYGGEFLTGIKLTDPAFEDYVQIERVHYHGIYQDLLREVVNYQIEQRDYQQARAIAERLISFDRGDEYAHRALMKAFLEHGDKVSALRQFTECKQYLMEAFGAMPSAETTNLHAEIQSDQSHLHQFQDDISTKSSRLSVGLSLFEYLPKESIVEEITHDFCSALASALTRFRWLSVHPSRSTFAYASQGVDAAEIGRRLDIAYLIDGRLIHRDNQVRLSIELVDVQSRTSIWAERFTSRNPVESLFATEILGAIVSRIDVRLRANEINKLVGRNTDNMDAFGCVLNAINEMHHMTHEAYESAKRLLEQAEKLDPNFSDIYSWRAFWLIFFIGQGYGNDVDQTLESAVQYAKRAIELNPEDALALAICGHAASFLNQDLQAACHYYNRSLKLNPHSSFAWMLSSATYSYLGDSEEALRRLEHSEFLCPIEPQYELLYNMARALANFVAQDYRNLTYWSEKTIRENGSFSNGYKMLIAGLGHLERKGEARKYVNRLLELEPEFTADEFVRQYPLAQPTDKARLLNDLVNAGAPRSKNESGVNTDRHHTKIE